MNDPFLERLTDLKQTLSPRQILSEEAKVLPDESELLKFLEGVKEVRLLLDLFELTYSLRFFSGPRQGEETLPKEVEARGLRTSAQRVINGYLRQKVAQEGRSLKLPVCNLATLELLTSLCQTMGLNPLDATDALWDQFPQFHQRPVALRNALQDYAAKIVAANPNPNRDISMAKFIG